MLKRSESYEVIAEFPPSDSPNPPHETTNLTNRTTTAIAAYEACSDNPPQERKP